MRIVALTMCLLAPLGCQHSRTADSEPPPKQPGHVTDAHYEGKNPTTRVIVAGDHFEPNGFGHEEYCETRQPDSAVEKYKAWKKCTKVINADGIQYTVDVDSYDDSNNVGRVTVHVRGEDGCWSNEIDVSKDKVKK